MRPVSAISDPLPWEEYENRSYPQDTRTGVVDSNRVCRKCQKQFGGHPLRKVCRECATPANQEPTALATQE